MGLVNTTINSPKNEQGATMADENEVSSSWNKCLYCFKQASRQWDHKFDEHVEKMRFEKSKYDSCVYFKDRNKATMLYLLYVDDIQISRQDKMNCIR